MKLIPWKKKEAAARGHDRDFGIGRLRTEMDRLFDRFFRDPWGAMEWGPLSSWACWAPAMDVRVG